MHTHQYQLVITRILCLFVCLFELTMKLSPTYRGEERPLEFRSLFSDADFTEIILDEDHTIRPREYVFIAIVMLLEEQERDRERSDSSEETECSM